MILSTMIPFGGGAGLRSAVMVCILMILGGGWSTAWTSENRGAPDILLEGGSRGNVPFAHRRHQDALEDCMVCHAVFAQERGSIEMLKSQGKLSGKVVMNQQCIKCHRARKDAAQTSGPVTCSECHERG